MLLFCINGMNVVNSDVNRDFMTAIADRDKAEFIRQALFYIAVFAGSTLLSVISRFTEERLGLLWREFVTGRAIGLGMAGGTYYRLDRPQEWATLLSLSEQQLLAVVRALLAAPPFVLLDHPETALGNERLQGILEALCDASITYVCFGGSDVPQELYDAVLDIGTHGSWTWTVRGQGGGG